MPSGNLQSEILIEPTRTAAPGVVVRKVGASAFAQAHRLLHELNADITESEWRRLFDYRWAGSEDCRGYGLFDGETMVGFLALIFSRREIAGRVENFCNLGSWFVKADYRGQGLRLLWPVARLTNHTLTDLSPTSAVISICQRLGFSPLDSRVIWLMPAVGGVRAGRPQGWFILQDVAQIEQQVAGRDLQLLRDHAAYASCEHLLLREGDAYCYAIFTVVRRSRLPHCYIHYVSDAGLFARHSLAIRAAMAKRAGTPLVFVDSRLVRNQPLPRACELPVAIRKTYRSSSLRPEQIDNLYSEFVLLDFSVLPGPSSVRRRVLSRAMNLLSFRH
jgi:hypothetical protein